MNVHAMISHVHFLLNGCSYIKNSLGGPSAAEFESVKAERDQLQKRVAELEQQLKDAKGE